MEVFCWKINDNARHTQRFSLLMIVCMHTAQVVVAVKLNFFLNLVTICFVVHDNLIRLLCSKLYEDEY